MIAVGENGIFEPADIARLAKVDVQPYPVGESLMRQDGAAAAAKALLAYQKRYISNCSFISLRQGYLIDDVAGDPAIFLAHGPRTANFAGTVLFPKCRTRIIRGNLLVDPRLRNGRK